MNTIIRNFSFSIESESFLVDTSICQASISLGKIVTITEISLSSDDGENHPYPSGCIQVIVIGLGL